MNRFAWRNILMLLLVAIGLHELSKAVPAAEKAPLAKPVLKFATNPNHRPVVEAMIPLMEAKGYKIEIKTFDDPISIDVATEEGSVDANLYQHRPYMENFNRSRGGHLVMAKPYLYTCLMGLFSKRHKSLSSIPEGGVIALAMDASNKDRALRMMHANGLISLNDISSTKTYTPLDIASNPKKLKFIEVDLWQLLRSLEDVDAGAISASHLIAAGLDASGALCFTQDDDQYAIGVVLREQDKDSQWAKDMMESFISGQCRKAIQDYYKGLYRLLF